MNSDNESGAQKPFKLSDATAINSLARLGKMPDATKNWLAGDSAELARKAMHDAGLSAKALKEAVSNAGGVNALAAIAAETTSATLGVRNALAGAGGMDSVSLAIADALKPATEMKNALAGISQVSDHARMLAEVGKGLDQSDALKNVMAGLVSARGVEDRMKELRGVVGEGSSLGRIAQDIAEQQRSLDDWNAKTARMRDHSLPSIHVPKVNNPMAETNKRLARIEGQFEHALDAANRGVQTAVQLQATGAELLQKFEKAAIETNQSGGKAIRVAKFALVIAVVIPLAQIALTFLVPNHEAAALNREVVDLRAEVSGLRSEQAETSKRLIEALSVGDQATAAAVKEAVAAALAAQPPIPLVE